MFHLIYTFLINITIIYYLDYFFEVTFFTFPSLIRINYSNTITLFEFLIYICNVPHKSIDRPAFYVWFCTPANWHCIRDTDGCNPLRAIYLIRPLAFVNGCHDIVVSEREKVMHAPTRQHALARARVHISKCWSRYINMRSERLSLCIAGDKNYICWQRPVLCLTCVQKLKVTRATDEHLESTKAINYTLRRNMLDPQRAAGIRSKTIIHAHQQQQKIAT